MQWHTATLLSLFTYLIYIYIYIPPPDSLYFNDISFIKIQLLSQHFKYRTLFIAGDLNSRCDNIRHKNPSINHVANPDKIVNGNDKKLNNIFQYFSANGI